MVNLDAVVEDVVVREAVPLGTESQSTVKGPSKSVAAEEEAA